MHQVIPVLAIAIICVGCAPHHRNFSRVNLNGTFRITSISTSSSFILPYTRVIPEGGLAEGEIVDITQTESELSLAHGTKRKVFDLRSPKIYMRGRSVRYKPYQGARIILGPGTSDQYDNMTIKDDRLTIESKSFEAGLFLFLIPLKEGGTTTVLLHRMDSNHRVEPMTSSAASQSSKFAGMMLETSWSTAAYRIREDYGLLTAVQQARRQRSGGN